MSDDYMTREPGSVLSMRDDGKKLQWISLDDRPRAGWHLVTHEEFKAHTVWAADKIAGAPRRHHKNGVSPW